MTCPRCNTINPVGSLACATCGTPFAMQGGFAPPPPNLPPGYVMVAANTGLRTSGMAIAGFVLSFLGCLAILGLIFSIIGHNEIKQSNGQVKGEGLALAGIIISIVMLVMCVLFGVIGAMNPQPD
jgi:hypothetical protein